MLNFNKKNRQVAYYAAHIDSYVYPLQIFPQLLQNLQIISVLI